MKFNYTQILPPHQKAFKKLLSHLQKNFKVNFEIGAIRAFKGKRELWFKYNVKGETTSHAVYDFDSEKFTTFEKYDDALEFLNKKEVKEVKILKEKDSGMLSLF